MEDKDSVIEMKKPGQYTQDLLSEIAREGAQKMLAGALEAEVELFLMSLQTHVTEEGKRRYVRNG